MNDDTLRKRMRELIETGRLPTCRPETVFGGFGSGEPCILCDAPITQDDVCLEYECAPSDGSRLRSHLFHARCLATAESEWRNLARGTQIGETQPVVTAAQPASGHTQTPAQG